MPPPPPPPMPMAPMKRWRQPGGGAPSSRLGSAERMSSEAVAGSSQDSPLQLGVGAQAPSPASKPVPPPHGPVGISAPRLPRASASSKNTTTPP